jgi:hypothetical protein
MRNSIASVLFLAIVGSASPSIARLWRDATGQFTLEAEFVDATDDHAVLKRPDGTLVALERAELSVDDRRFLETHLNTGKQAKAPRLQTWTLEQGLGPITGRIVGYGRSEFVLERRRGRIFINNRVFGNLPPSYQRILLEVVSRADQVDLATPAALTSWIARHDGGPRYYTFDGVRIEFPDGDEYGIPFELFSTVDQKALRPGWERWLAAREEARKRRLADSLLEAQARALQEDRSADRRIAEMQLLLRAVEAGVVSLWEVTLHPKSAERAWPIFVVVPARDSAQAAAAAAERNPSYVVGPIRRLN